MSGDGNHYHVVSFSGGKDSTAVWNIAKKAGVTLSKADAKAKSKAQKEANEAKKAEAKKAAKDAKKALKDEANSWKQLAK